MDHTALSLKISGPLLSKLMHECYCYRSNCGGLLYGEVATTTRNEITDSQHRTTTDSSICVQDYQPLSQKKFFSNHKERKADAWSSSNFMSSCIGFYSIRKSTNSLSLLEKSMHKTLCRHSVQQEGLKGQDGIVTLLITHEANLDATCLSWKIKAYVWRATGEFSAIKVSISNLQGSVSSSYISNPNFTNKGLSNQTSAILHSFQSSISEDNGEIKVVEATKEVTTNLITKLDNTVDELVDNQVSLENALREKSALMEQLHILTAKRKSLAKRNVIVKETPLMAAVNTMGAEKGSDHMLQGMAWQKNQYEMDRRKSIEDMKTRSPVVVLERVDKPLPASEQSSHSNHETQKHISSKEPTTHTDTTASQEDASVTNDLIQLDDIA